MFLKFLSGKKELSDEELARRYRKSGDMDLLGELYGRHMEMVFAICMKYLKNEAESQDLVMQLFEKLVDELKLHEVNNFKSWLYRVARNHCLMHLRSVRNKFNNNMLPFENELEDSMENEGFLHQDSGERLEKTLTSVEKGIHTLPKEQKQCIELFFLQEKCYKDIVDITGYDLKKVKSYIQNGKRNLKIYMEKEADG